MDMDKTIKFMKLIKNRQSKPLSEEDILFILDECSLYIDAKCEPPELTLEGHELLARFENLEAAKSAKKWGQIAAGTTFIGLLLEIYSLSQK